MPGLGLGSPPRRRGKEVADEGIGGIIRITPAWAGKSGRVSGTAACYRDHPRVGGEKSCAASTARRVAGSPPRGRGKAHRPRTGPGWTGITPAWAGKRMRCRLGYGQSRDHPRAGGEKAPVLSLIRGMLGSPPHRRGKGFRRIPVVGFEGITPAWAGKSPASPSVTSGPRDHPRVGGEKQIRP